MQKVKTKTHYTVIGFDGPDQVINRIKELGIRANENIYIQTKIPLGGPYVVRFKNAHIALRKDELECLQLQAPK